MTVPVVEQRSAPARGRPAIAGLRQRILDAAMTIFARHDYHEVLMDDVARQSGVAKGTLYRYFPSKRALYLGVMFEGIDRLHDALQEAVGGSGEPVRKLARLVYTLLDHFWDRRFFFAQIHRNEYRPDDPDSREWERRRAQISRLIQRLVEEAIDRGELRAIDPRVAGEMLLGMLRGVNRYRTAADTLPGLVNAVLEVFLRGVGTETGRRELDALLLAATAVAERAGRR
jgi:AcrR family transcriptional regulator